MKWLWELLLLCLLAALLLVIGIGLCFLGGFIAVCIAGIFTNNGHVIFFTAICGFVGTIAIIFVLSYIAFNYITFNKFSKKNSQKDTRE